MVAAGLVGIATATGIIEPSQPLGRLIIDSPLAHQRMNKF